MQPLVRTRSFSLRVAAPTTTRTLRYVGLLGGALIVGGAAIWRRRQPWALEQIGPWLLLLVGMFAAAQSLRQLELWLPGEPMFPRLATYPVRARRQLGVVLICTSVGIGLYVIARLLPDLTK